MNLLDAAVLGRVRAGRGADLTAGTGGLVDESAGRTGPLHLRETRVRVSLITEPSRDGDRDPVLQGPPVQISQKPYIFNLFI